jgi:hypothetical protein
VAWRERRLPTYKSSVVHLKLLVVVRTVATQGLLTPDQNPFLRYSEVTIFINDR